MIEILNSLIRSLNQVETRGKGNLDILLGCIMMLEKLRDMAMEGDDGDVRNTNHSDG